MGGGENDIFSVGLTKDARWKLKYAMRNFSEERGCRNFLQIWLSVSVTAVTLHLSSLRQTRLSSYRAKRVRETLGFSKFSLSGPTTEPNFEIQIYFFIGLSVKQCA